MITSRKNSKSKNGGDATIELMMERIRHLELSDKTLNDKLEAVEAREKKLEGKIDMLIQQMKHTVKVDKNQDKLDNIKGDEPDNILQQQRTDNHPKEKAIIQPNNQKLDCNKCNFNCLKKFE